MPKRHIAITPEITNTVTELALSQGWSFSRALNYITYLGLLRLAQWRRATVNFKFDVDHPKRRKRSKLIA